MERRSKGNTFRMKSSPLLILNNLSLFGQSSSVDVDADEIDKSKVKQKQVDKSRVKTKLKNVGNEETNN